jgi:hypothetical protein
VSGSLSNFTCLIYTLYENMILIQQQKDHLENSNAYADQCVGCFITYIYINLLIIYWYIIQLYVQFLGWTRTALKYWANYNLRFEAVAEVKIDIVVF